MILIRRFSAMPFPLKIVFLAMIFSPLLAFGSVLSGTFLPPGAPLAEYGAARGFTEMFLVGLGSSVLALVTSVLILNKSRRALILFPVAFLAATLVPYLLPAVREYDDQFWDSAVYTAMVGAVVWGYLFLSPAVRRYLAENDQPA